MKKSAIIVMLVILLGTGSLYAQSGNLIVNGNLGVGTTTPNYGLSVVNDLGISNFLVGADEACRSHQGTQG